MEPQNVPLGSGHLGSCLCWLSQSPVPSCCSASLLSLPSGGSLLPTRRGVFLPPAGGVLDGAQPLARTCGVGEEPQAGTCAVPVQFPSRLSGTDRIVLQVNVVGIAYLPSTPHHLWG